RLDARGRCQAVVGGGGGQRVVRQRTQQRERQLAGDLVGREGGVRVFPARVRGRRRTELRSINEGRRDDDGLDRQLDARLVVLHRPLGVDLHQVGHLARVQRAPVGLLGEGGHPIVRASGLRGGGRSAARGDRRGHGGVDRGQD